MTGTLLVRGRWLVTDARSEVLEDAALLIGDGVVKEVSSYKSLAAKHPEAKVAGGENCAVIPGLINAHHHSHAIPSILHGLPDLLLEPWILAWHGIRPADPYLNTLVSAGVQLGAGVTGVIDMMSTGGNRDRFSESVEQSLKAHEQSGLRACLAAGCSSRSFLVCGDGEDRRFLESLPGKVRPLAESLLPDADHLSEEDYLSVMQDLHRNQRGNSRVSLWYGPPGPQWISDRCMESIAGDAQRFDCGIQTHVNESLYEKLHGERFYGKPTVCHLDELGVLSPRLSIAHGTWLNETEIEIMARTGAGVSHNPSSNLRLRAGIAPFQALFEGGVTTAIGMDSTTINDNEDMFAEIRLALRLQCDPRIDRKTPTTADLVSAATSGGAKLMGKEKMLGRLQPGYAADLVILDTARMIWPWIAPEANPLDVIFLRAGRQDIQSVMIAGEFVWADGGPTRFDLKAAAAELAEHVSACTPDREARRAVETVLPYLENWYADWQSPELAPWKPVSSRK